VKRVVTPYAVIVWVAVALLISACAPSFNKFEQVPKGTTGFTQYRVQADGNAVVSTLDLEVDTLLYKKKLNGGITAQVVGNSQFLIVPTFNKRVYFLNPVTGKEITSYETNSAIASAAAVRDQLVYFVDQEGGDKLTCLNLINGKIVFKRDLHDSQTPPIIADDDLFVTSRMGTLFDMNRYRGDTTWSFKANSQIYAAPAASEDIVVLGTADGVVHCLERATGKVRWEVATGATIYAQPMVADYVYCGSGDHKMYAFDKATGDLVWYFETGEAIHTTPALIANRLIFGSDDEFIYCLNAQSGDTLWTFQTDAIVQASPVVAGATVVVANGAGTVYILDLDGNLLKQFQTDGSIKSSPAVIDGRVYVTTTSRKLFCFGPRRDLRS
jgi:outer membrane protein assembly factor BamB